MRSHASLYARWVGAGDGWASPSEEESCIFDDFCGCYCCRACSFTDSLNAEPDTCFVSRVLAKIVSRLVLAKLPLRGFGYQIALDHSEIVT
jgi:hypothetical protein